MLYAMASSNIAKNAKLADSSQLCSSSFFVRARGPFKDLHLIVEENSKVGLDGRGTNLESILPCVDGGEGVFGNLRGLGGVVDSLLGVRAQILHLVQLLGDSLHLLLGHLVQGTLRFESLMSA